MKEETKQELKETGTATLAFLSDHPGLRGFLIGFVLGFLVAWL